MHGTPGCQSYWNLLVSLCVLVGTLKGTTNQELGHANKRSLGAHLARRSPPEVLNLGEAVIVKGLLTRHMLVVLYRGRRRGVKERDATLGGSSSQA